MSHIFRREQSMCNSSQAQALHQDRYNLNLFGTFPLGGIKFSHTKNIPAPCGNISRDRWNVCNTNEIYLTFARAIAVLSNGRNREGGIKMDEPSNRLSSFEVQSNECQYALKKINPCTTRGSYLAPCDCLW